MMPGFGQGAYSSSSDSDDEGNAVVVTKKSLVKASAMIKGERQRASAVRRMCQSAGLRELGLRAAADNCSPDSPMVEMLEELRISLLENDDSASAKILEWFLHSATKIHLPIIWRTAAVLFLKPHVSQKNRDAFLEKCAGKFDPEDKARLIETLTNLQPIAKARKRRQNDSVVSISDEDDPGTTLQPIEKARKRRRKDSVVIISDEDDPRMTLQPIEKSRKRRQNGSVVSISDEDDPQMTLQPIAKSRKRRRNDSVVRISNEDDPQIPK